MGYEPTILVRKRDLEKQSDTIRYAEYNIIPNMKFKGRNAKENKQKLIDAYSVLEKALDYETVKFPEIELVIIYVEPPSKNWEVRNLLDELGIEYKLDD